MIRLLSLAKKPVYNVVFCYIKSQKTLDNIYTYIYNCFVHKIILYIVQKFII